LQHFCNNIIILNYYYFIPGLFPSHSWWAESCSVRVKQREHRENTLGNREKWKKILLTPQT